MTKPQQLSPSLDLFDWLQLLFCLLGGSGLAVGLLIIALQTFLEPKLLAETALRTSRSVRLVELALRVIPPSQLPKGVIVQSSWHGSEGPEGPIKPLAPFDRKLQLLMSSRYGVDRELQRDAPPFIDSWGGMWVQLRGQNPGSSLWLYQPERLSSSSVWFMPLVRSGALLVGLAFGTVVFLKTRVEGPFKNVLLELPDGLPTPLPLLPEEGISPLRVLSLRINRLLERLNVVGTDRRQLLRGIVHDLAGPQTRIGLQLDLMRDSLEVAHLQALDAIESDLRQMAGITQHLGLLAERDQPRIPIQQLALDDLCTRVTASYVRYPIRLRIPRLLVRLDGEGLERALRNLIDNALEHGKPPVEIEAWLGQSTTLVLQVKDHGGGMPTTDTLLTMPHQSPSHDRERSRHRGLGLAIVERFCRDHQGKLVLPSSEWGFTAQMHLLATAEGPVLLWSQPSR